MSPAMLVAGVVVVALVVYTLTGGADFGGGVWDLLAWGPRAGLQRTRIAEAIGPIWEANHVWLILVIVLLFVGFPRAFVAVSIALHVPLTLMLFGVVLRGSAFVFRAYGEGEDAARRRWTRVFAAASAFTPLMLGVSLGAVASGRLRAPGGQAPPDFFGAWLAPFPFAIGLFTLGLFSLLAAVYLAVEIDDDESLRDDFRARALAAALVTAALAYASLLLSHAEAPPVWDALTGRWWSVPFHAVTVGLGVALLAALWSRRFGIARVLAVALVVVVEIGWTAGQAPYVIPPDLTIEGAAAPASVLRPVLWALLAGAVLLLPSFAYLYRVFKAEPSR